MALYNNNSGEVSKIGLVAVADPKNPKGFIYAQTSSTSILGIVNTVSPKYSPCEIATQGIARVFCSTSVTKGSTIRLGKNGDNISRATCTTAKTTDVPYFKIGTALESGRGLIRCSLEFAYVASLQTGSFQPAGNYQPLNANLTRLANNRRIGGDSSYTEFASDGTMTMVGDATVWDDLRITPGAFDYAGTGDPDLIDYQPGGSGATFKVYSFQSGDQAFFTVQLPHGYEPGSDIYVHVHWTPGSRGNEENGKTVAWKVDYSWADINDNFPASAVIDLTDTCDGTDHKHQMTPDILLTGVAADKTISSMLICRIFRDAGDTWAGTIAAQSPILLEVDFHVPLNTVGSTTHTSK